MVEVAQLVGRLEDLLPAARESAAVDEDELLNRRVRLAVERDGAFRVDVSTLAAEHADA